MVGAELYGNSLLKKDFPQVKIDIIPRVTSQEALLLVAKSHFGIVLIRNEDFDFGTKIFEYIGLGITPFGIFDKNRSFYNFFKPYLNANNSFVDQKKFARKTIWKTQIITLFSTK